MLLIFLGFIFSSVYYISDISASSEFLVFNTKGSYNLGCELDNSCFEPYIVNILVGDTVTWKLLAAVQQTKQKNLLRSLTVKNLVLMKM